MKNKLYLIILIVSSLSFMISCSKKNDSSTAAGTCSDGIKNQTETGIDCGGPCAACPTCSDGIQNQGETAVDCGGPCGACPNSLSCKVDGVTFTGTNLNVTDNVFAVGIEIQATKSGAVGGYPQVHILMPDTETPGTYNMATTVNDGYYLLSSSSIVKEISGQLIITVHNTLTQHIEGTFYFNAQKIDGTGPIYAITNGAFSVNY